MFAELPKLFDRNFAMAFFLPVMAAIWVGFEMLSGFGLTPNLIAFVQVERGVRTVILFLIAWLLGILLLATNQGLYRILEGYESWNPLRLFKWIEVRRFQRLLQRIEALNEKDREAGRSGDELPFAQQAKLGELMIIYAKRFPHSQEYLLPTPFGNTIRAFEVYSTVMYGIESIDGWSRLLAVTPPDYRELMDNAKSHVDFWVNVGFLSLGLLAGCIALAIYFQALPAWWVLGVLALFSLISPGFARSSAVEWGDYVKAAFDMFRPRMREALEFEAPQSKEREIEQWTCFSQAIVFRLPKMMPKQVHRQSPPDGSASMHTRHPGDAPAAAPAAVKKRGG